MSTGLWTHWFRSLGLAYFANVLENPLALCKIYGIKKVNVVLKYFKIQWTQYKDKYALAKKSREVA